MSSSSDQAPDLVTSSVKPLPQLHPLVPAGDFNLPDLLEHEPPTRWMPEPGEGVEGEVVQLRDVKAFGQTSPVLFLITEDERYLTVRCGGVVLRGFVDQYKPSAGDRVAIVYDGLRESASGREYRSYRSLIRKTGRAA